MKYIWLVCIDTLATFHSTAPNTRPRLLRGGWARQEWGGCSRGNGGRSWKWHRKNRQKIKTNHRKERDRCLKMHKGTGHNYNWRLVMICSHFWKTNAQRFPQWLFRDTAAQNLSLASPHLLLLGQSQAGGVRRAAAEETLQTPSTASAKQSKDGQRPQLHRWTGMRKGRHR